MKVEEPSSWNLGFVGPEENCAKTLVFNLVPSAIVADDDENTNVIYTN
ncbi:hypothetical protein HanPSC8_Chr17g0786521 [Helianthus annuus]|nr:hypothetical protein HanPSC8_Chr17g0786521 [Helianthus annuus]